MPVNKANCELYRVHREGEYATVVIQGWITPSESRTNPIQHGGELVVHGTFGTFGYTWTNTARPFKEFLLGLGFNSLMGKCFGVDIKVYCPDATRQEFSKLLDAFVGQDTITAEQSALVLKVFDNEFTPAFGRSPSAFVQAIENTRADDEVEAALSIEALDAVFGEAVMLRGTTVNSQAQGFWDLLWPDIVAALKSEMQVREASHAA